jgi:hypothetical protein
MLLTSADICPASIGHLHDYEAYSARFKQRYTDACDIGLNILIDEFADNVWRLLYQKLTDQLTCLVNDIYDSIDQRLTNDPRYLYFRPQGYTNEEIKDMTSTVYRILQYWNRYCFDGYRLIVKKDAQYVIVDGVKYCTVSIYKGLCSRRETKQQYKLFKTDYASLFEKTCRSNMDLFGNFERWYAREIFLSNTQMLYDTVDQIIQQITLQNQEERIKEE